MLAVVWDTLKTAFAVSKMVFFVVLALIYIDSVQIYPNFLTVPRIVVAVSRSTTSKWSPTAVRVNSQGLIPYSVSVASPSTLSLLVSVEAVSSTVLLYSGMWTVITPALPTPVVMVLLLVFILLSTLFIVLVAALVARVRAWRGALPYTVGVLLCFSNWSPPVYVSGCLGHLCFLVFSLLFYVRFYCFFVSL